MSTRVFLHLRGPHIWFSLPFLPYLLPSFFIHLKKLSKPLWNFGGIFACDSLKNVNACLLSSRLERLEHLAKKFKHKSDIHESWTHGKEELLSSQVRNLSASTFFLMDVFVWRREELIKYLRCVHAGLPLVPLARIESLEKEARSLRE